VKVFASGDLDEYGIAKLVAGSAAIDAFGVGTALASPGDAPNLSLIYKLVEVERGGKVREAAKFSQAKVTYPGRKQVYRHARAGGEYAYDRVALEDEPANGAEGLLVEVMRGGRRTTATESLGAMRERCAASLKCLPPRYKQMRRAAVYPVRYSARLEAMLDQVRRRVRHATAK